MRYVSMQRDPAQGTLWIRGRAQMNVMKIRADQEALDPAKTPAHALVYDRLRDHILFGELAPGQAVTIQGLTDALGAGMTPVREAIRRLISDGALAFKGNRRVTVPVLTRADLEELVFVRKSVETQLAWRAAQRIDADGLAQLERIDAALDAAILAGDVQEYLRKNYGFHAQLYAYSDAPIMTGIADRLWLRFGPSLRVVCGRFGTQNLPDRHKDMLHALRAGDAAAASEAMLQDVLQGMDQIGQMLSDDGTRE